MQVKKFFTDHWQIILILLIAAILRFWRLEALTTFGGDQGYDFLIIKRMLVDGKFTLLGPKIGPYNEIGNLYLGPAYYYLLAPFLFIFNLDPIGPALLTVLLALGTIFLIYLICTKFLNKPIAILACSFYAFNTFLINQSRAPSNPHLIPIFAALLLLALLQVNEKNRGKSLLKSAIWPPIAGISLGIMFQLHYLSAALIPVVLIFLIFNSNIKKLIYVLIAFLLAVMPQIIFEFRHGFFVTNLFLKQLHYGQTIANFNQFNDNLSRSLETLFPLFINTDKFLIVILAVFLILIFYYERKNSGSLDPQPAKQVRTASFAYAKDEASSQTRQATFDVANFERRSENHGLQAVRIYYRFKSPDSKKTIFLLLSTTILSLLVVSFYRGSIDTHYFAPIYVSLVILLSIAFYSSWNLFKNYLIRTLLTILILQVFAFNFLKLDLGKNHGYTMPEGWNLKGVKVASKIIAHDVNADQKFNIAATLDGDTRARPYRYLVEVYGKHPLDVEQYPEADIIYLISRDDQAAIKSYTVWEVASFAPFMITKLSDIQNGIKLYKLARTKVR